jgi:hypothetical protein
MSADDRNKKLFRKLLERLQSKREPLIISSPSQQEQPSLGSLRELYKQGSISSAEFDALRLNVEDFTPRLVLEEVAGRDSGPFRRQFLGEWADSSVGTVSAPYVPEGITRDEISSIQVEPASAAKSEKPAAPKAELAKPGARKFRISENR